MSLLPSYTAPPAVGWKASWLADEPRNRANPNNPLVGLDAIKSSQGPTYTMVNPGGSFTAPSFSALDPLMNNRAAWVFDSSLDRIATYNLTAFGPYASSVMVVRIPQITGGSTASYGMQDGVTPRWSVIQAGYSTGDLTWGFHGQGSGARFPLVRPIFDRPILLVTRLTASESSISVNGDTYTGATYSTNPSITSLGLGDANIGGGEQSLSMRVGFYGVYSGDVTTDPQWSNFLDWVQSHYGFDPRATYDTSQPPPISWRAEYLADDFDATTGTWPDRTGRGYTVNPGNGLCVTPLGLRSFGASGTGSATNCATVANFAGLQFAGDFEVQAKIRDSTLVAGSTCTIGGCYTTAAASARWGFALFNGTLQLKTSNGATYQTYNSTANLPLGFEHMWVRATWSKNEGGNAVARFYYGWDGINWIQLGVAVSLATHSLPSSNNPLYLSGYDGNINFAAPRYLERFIVKNGIGGSSVVDINFAAATPGTLSFSESASGQTVNILSSTPTKVANVVNGQPVVRFDGVNDYLKASGLSLVGSLTTVMIARKRSSTGSVTWIGTNSNGVIPGSNGITQWVGTNLSGQNVGVGATLPTDWNLLRLYQTGSGSDVFAVNETVLTSSWNIGTGGATDIYIAANAAFGAYADIDVAYVGVFSGDVTTSALWSAFKTWVTSKYGITLS